MIKSIIFDFDGVIADSHEVHKKSLQWVARAIRAEFDEKNYQDTIAQPLSSCLRIYLDINHPTYMLEDLVKIYKDCFFTHLDEINLIEGVTDVIEKLSKHSFPAAIASSSTSDYIKHLLSNFGFLDYFDGKICSIDMVQNGKPAPDLFLLAAEKLHSKPQDCLVIENAIDGIIAADRAGMESLLLCKTHHPDLSKYNSTQIDNLVDIFNTIKI